MGTSRIESGGLPEENREALQSETWRKAGEGMKARREIKHFPEGTSMGYGPEWGAVVNEYLKTAYKEGDKGCDLEVAGVAYRILRRDKVTAFYDSEGDTLFDVANERLEEEYESLGKCGNPAREAETASGEQKEAAEKEPLASVVVPENAADVKEKAKEKLEDELKNAKDKSFADPIIKYLLGRCEEDKGLSEDVLQKHKTWEKCLDYVYSLARKQASGNCAAVRDEVVYEWAEDYYHKDDKAEEAEKAKKAAEVKKKVAERAAKAKENVGNRKTENKAVQGKKKSPAPAEEAEEKRTRRNNKDLEGQMDMFSMMGI